MIVGGVAVGALSIAAAFTLFQFMMRGPGPGPGSETKSTPVIEIGSEAETIVELETPVGISERPLARSLEGPLERPLERPSEAPLILPLERQPERPFDSPSLGLSVGPVTESKQTSEISNPLTYLIIDPAYVDEITQFLAALKKRSGVVQTQ